MPVRRFVCAIVLMGVASPAAAGERPGYSATPDALTLLLKDDSTTYGARVPPTGLPVLDAATRTATRLEPLPDTIARFEAMMVPARMALPAVPGVEALSFTMAMDPGAAESPAASFDARRAIHDAMADYPRPFRRRAMLDTMLTFRLDGEEKTRSFTVGGIAGAVWGALPRR